MANSIFPLSNILTRARAVGVFGTGFPETSQLPKPVAYSFETGKYPRHVTNLSSNSMVLSVTLKSMISKKRIGSSGVGGAWRQFVWNDWMDQEMGLRLLSSVLKLHSWSDCPLHNLLPLIRAVMSNMPVFSPILDPFKYSS
jgi:hypothetical protein